MKLFVVGKFNEYLNTVDGLRAAWEYCGIFDSEVKALKAICSKKKDKHLYFVGPTTLNENLSENIHTWPGCYYPCNEFYPPSL